MNINNTTNNNNSNNILGRVSYLHYPVSGLQAGTLSWRVLVHGSDVLSRPCPLAVQVEAISVGPSLDRAETWPQLGTHLLDRNRQQRKETGRRVTTLKQPLFSQKIPPPWASVQREPAAQRLWRAPPSP